MAKSRNKSNKRHSDNNFSLPSLPRLEIGESTKIAILAIFLVVFSLILILGYGGLAGSVGKVLSNFFKGLMGKQGRFILPVIFLVLAVSLIREKFNVPRRIYLATFVGGGLILYGCLSLISIMHADGGKIGASGLWWRIYLGTAGAVIFLVSLVIIGWFIALNIGFDAVFKKKEVSPDEESKKVSVPQDSLLNKIFDKNNLLSKTEVKVNDNLGNNNSDTKNLSQDAKKELKKNKGEVEEAFQYKHLINYILPPLDLLDADTDRPTSGDIRANTNIIKRTLQNFGIEVEMAEINVGPTVTQYTLKPAEGIRLSRIVALQNDLSLALAANPLRLEAPIPGKSLVGIEVPNKSVAIVRLKNILQQPDFTEHNNPLMFALGRDVTGSGLYASLDKMPHLLIAGATGTGKSVCIHNVIISLLMRNSPEILKLILIDPKRVELSHYNGIPHLLTPVITDNKKALPALRWAIIEMEKRYDLLQKSGSRDIKSYNTKALSRKEPPLPYIVIMIDELADLMMSYGREIEGAIVRLAQMARAVGIHLVISTQRPSVEVITGLIKANITARIAFQVASQIDSRTILDAAGAEKLLGHGDMLYLAPDSSKPKRIQASYVTEKEVDKVVSYILDQADKFIGTNEEITLDDKSRNGVTDQINLDSFGDEEDDMYDQAYDLVVESQKASASFLQRRLRVGYARAARLLDILEERGVIGPGDGAKPREVMVSKADVDAQKFIDGHNSSENNNNEVIEE
jgi:S-DNA-T family DNA segregation ATPase FtsK/SpoIIIE